MLTDPGDVPETAYPRRPPVPPRPMRPRIEHRPRQYAQCVLHQSVPHFKQRYSWDCGIACVSMILSFYGKDVQQMYDSWQNKRVWTIELAFALYKSNINFQYFTKMLGADTRHESKSFYVNFRQDESVINSLFADGERLGMKLIRKGMEMPEFVQHLSMDQVAIVLVNGNVLQCQHCSSLISNAIHGLMANSFYGHYIVVVGNDAISEWILYRDPAHKERLCRTSYKIFDKARKNSGTDQDIIFISLK